MQYFKRKHRIIGMLLMEYSFFFFKIFFEYHFNLRNIFRCNKYTKLYTHMCDLLKKKYGIC